MDKIDLTGIVRSRVGGIKGKLIPGFLLRGLEKIICQEQLNHLLEVSYPAKGSAFSDRILKELKITLDVKGLDALPAGESFIFASNHPLGGLDGIALVKVLGEKFGDENMRVLVNDMLMHVEPLKEVFLPVNKFGRQGKSAASKINEAYTSGKQIVMFPAGLVSRLGDNGIIKDLDWQKAFVSKALEYNRRIVPVRFVAQNRLWFYKVARWRKKLGIKVNIEQALLPGEVCASGQSEYKIIFGKPIEVRPLLNRGESPLKIAAAIKQIVYSLPF